MGLQLVSFYREKVKDTWKLAFFSAFILGLVVHIYKFTNQLPNWDAMYNSYNSQNMVATGRWFLTVACSFSSYFDLPWFNGLLSVLFMSLTAVFVSEVFSMKNPCLILLSSGLLVTFPAITATMTYEYTADGYMLAMVLAALSVCLTKMEYMGRDHWKKQVLSAVCICIACGIYQAYVSFAFVLALCYFMTELLENRWENSRYWKWIVTQIVIYVCALAAYYLIWKLCLKLQGIGANTYQGVDQVGLMGGTNPIGLLIKILKVFVVFFLEWNIFEHGLTAYSALNILFLAAFGAGLLTAVWKSGCLKRKMHFVLFLLCTAALPVGCYICYLTSPDVFYHSLMVQSICLLYILTAVIYERWLCPKAGNLVLVLLAAIIFNNSVAANICYNQMDRTFKRTQATATELSTRIHLLDDGTVRYVAILGSLKDWDEESQYRGEELRHLGGWKSVERTLLSSMFLAQYTDFDLSYYSSQGLEYPVVEFDAEVPAPKDSQFRFPLLGNAEQEVLAQREEVRDMPIWPAADSVRVIGDTVVVKLSEIEEVPIS